MEDGEIVYALVESFSRVVDEVVERPEEAAGVVVDIGAIEVGLSA